MKEGDLVRISIPTDAKIARTRYHGQIGIVYKVVVEQLSSFSFTTYYVLVSGIVTSFGEKYLEVVSAEG